MDTYDEKIQLQNNQEMSGIHSPSLATTPSGELARDVSYWCVFFNGYRRIQRALALGSIATVAVCLATLCATTIE